MKIAIALTSVIVSGFTYGCGDIHEPVESSKSAAKIIHMDDDYCGNNPSYEIFYDKEFGGHKFTRTLLSVLDGFKIKFSASLAEIVGEEGHTYFCLPSEYAGQAVVVIDYGVDQCTGSKHSFTFKDFSRLKKGVPIDFDRQY